MLCRVHLFWSVMEIYTWYAVDAVKTKPLGWHIPFKNVYERLILVRVFKVRF